MEFEPAGAVASEASQSDSQSEKSPMSSKKDSNQGSGGGSEFQSQDRLTQQQQQQSQSNEAMMSQFRASKLESLEGFTHLPSCELSGQSMTLTKHLLTKRMGAILKDSTLDFVVLFSELKQVFLKIQERIERKHFYYSSINSLHGDGNSSAAMISSESKVNAQLRKDCCAIFESALRNSGLCCVTYCVNSDTLRKYDASQLPQASSQQHSHANGDTCDSELSCEVDAGNAAKYIVMFTGLDNIVDPEVNAGSMFGIWKRVTTKFRPLSEREDILQSCSALIASGYCMYGQATQMVLAISSDVNGFVYDPAQKEFLLSHPRIKAAQRQGIFSVDTAKEVVWEPHIKIFLNRRYARKDKKQTMRYTGSFVSDAHRTLLYGGVLMFPICGNNPEGDVSLVEAFIMSYVFEKAWGRASQGEGGSLMQMRMFSLQQKTQFYCGSSIDIVELENLYLSIARRQSINKSVASRFSSNQSIALNNSLELSVKSGSSQ